MGNDQSSANFENDEYDENNVNEDNENNNYESEEDGEGDCYGYRVLGIQEKSPASNVGFVSFFDFIVAANGIRLDQRDSTFLELIGNNEDRPMLLSVYNVKSTVTRELSLTPSNDWPGKGLLGVTIRFDSYDGAEDEVIHILETKKKSPAELAGLEAYNDYVLGTPERVFRDPDEFHDELMENMNHSFQCYIYNVKTDQVRLVSILPSDEWGGNGCLGAEIGFGYLHRLPERCRKTIGTSIGFVSISKSVVAATEAYGRQMSSEKRASREHDMVEEKKSMVPSNSQRSSGASSESDNVVIATKQVEASSQDETMITDKKSEKTEEAPVILASPKVLMAEIETNLNAVTIDDGTAIITVSEESKTS